MKLRGSRAQGLLTAVAAVLSLLWGVFLGARHLDGERTVLDRVEAVSADLRFLLAGERKAPDELVIVAVDDAAIRQAGSWPVPRTVIADLVRRIAAHWPRAVAIDILFIDPGPEGADAELSLALRSVPSVIAAALPEELGAGRTEGPAAPLWPNARLADAAAIGLVNVQVESGTPRHVPLLIRNGGAILPSFALRAASVALGVEPVLETDGVVLGARTVPTDLGYRLPLRFYGGRGTIRTVSAARVLGGEIEPALLRDRIVVVGVMDSTSRDTFPTPFDPHLSGAEVLATAIGHLVSGGGLIRTRTVRLVDAAATALLPVLTVLLVALRRTGIGLTLAGLVTIAWIGLTGVAFAEGTWLSVALPLAAVGPAAILYGGVRLWFDRRESKRHADAEEALRRFQPPVLAERLAEDPGFLAAPVRQDAAVVFLDLTGFTGLAETVGPERTRTLLKRFHALIEDEVTARKGLVTSFMGDGAMILFGLPDPDPKDACHAIEAAMALAHAISVWLDTVPADLRGPMGVRVGAHHGPVILSRLGADRHEHITATGDTVNVASRLLEVSAQIGAPVILSDALVRASGEACPASAQGRLSAPMEVPIRGRAQILTVRTWHPGEAFAPQPRVSEHP